MSQSLYQRLGGQDAIEVALDVFYKKVMADNQLKSFFDAVNLGQLKQKQRAFLTMAFGGPNTYDGRDLREAHSSAVAHGLNDELFNRFMSHFRATLEELSVPDNDITQVMEIAYGGKEDVLNR